MKAVRIHSAAEAFPRLDEKRLQQLAEDIRTNGQREPVKVIDGAVIDGRNRVAACEIIGIEPRVEHLPNDIDPWAYVWSLNGERRDLTADQRYLIWKRCHENSAAWQDEQRRIAEEANRKRAEAAEAGRVGRAAAKREETAEVAFSRATTSGTTKADQDKPHGPNRSTTAKAAASKTNRGAVERMDALSAKRPDLAEKVEKGEMPAAAAIREMKRDHVVAKLEDTAAREAKAASGLYDVIVMDPPWPMQKIERDERPNQVEFDYPTMSEDELAAMPVPAADDCHLWVWTTHKFTPMALRLIERWGFKYVCTFVWHKPGGFQPIGLPQFNCEFAVYARKGAPSFIDTKAFFTAFNAPRGKHSEKPAEFYDVVRRVTAGRRLDMFNRRVIDGFIPEIKRIVGPHLLVVTPEEIDCKQAADLMVFAARDKRIAARVRRPGFADRYPFEFTIRARRESGAETEQSKIVNGWGDWFFYGFAAADGLTFDRWWLIDLDAFRAALIRRDKHRIKMGTKSNGDGTFFAFFDLRTFPDNPPILIAGSHKLPCTMKAAA